MGCKLSTSQPTDTVNAFTSMVRTSVDDAVRDAASELFCINRDYVDRFVQLKGDVSSNIEHMKLVTEQLKTTMETLHFLDDLIKCFRIKVRDMVLPFLAADGSSGAEVIIQKVKDFKATGELLAMMRLNYEQIVNRQESVLRAVHSRKNRLDDRLGKLKAWRKAWDIVYSTVNFAVIVLSVVLTVLTAPPAATAAATGASGVMGLVRPWVGSKWDDYQSSLDAERKLTEKILNEASLTFYGLNDVGVLLEHLEVQIAALTSTDYAKLGLEEDHEDAAARMVVEKMKEKAEVVMASVKSLGERADRRQEELRASAVTFSQSVTDQVGGFYNGEISIPVGDEN